MRILNLYAGIGGNRKLWSSEHEVTAVENNVEIAKIYRDFFPNDKVIVEDAHQYLLEHYKEFEFIWSSPPCPTHSKARYWASKGGRYDVKYPDMGLYEEIIFLNNFIDDGKWVVENVDGYYNPLIEPIKVAGHFFWSNFNIQKKSFSRQEIRTVKGNLVYGFDLKGLKLSVRKDAVIRNTVNPELGLYIFNLAFKESQKMLVNSEK